MLPGRGFLISFFFFSVHRHTQHSKNADWGPQFQVPVGSFVTEGWLGAPPEGCLSGPAHLSVEWNPQ